MTEQQKKALKSVLDAVAHAYDKKTHSLYGVAPSNNDYDASKQIALALGNTHVCELMNAVSVAFHNARKNNKLGFLDGVAPSDEAYDACKYLVYH